MPSDEVAVGIVGAGPAGLLLSHLLDLAGISSVVLEARSEEYALSRVRAGVLEQNTVDLLREVELGDRLDRESMPHDGIELRLNGRRHHVDVRGIAGRSVTVYGQQEVVKDLIAASRAAGRELLFDAEVTAVEAVEGRPVVRYRRGGEEHQLRVGAVAGCDGFHGICRGTIPAELRREYKLEYPYAWLGVMAEVAPSTEEVIYAYHDRGFALHSMRSPSLSRLYVQCDPADKLEAWPDQRVWDELHTRFGEEGGWHLDEGPIVSKAITPMRTMVSEPMQYGRLYLAGDAAHIVPPAGAKGLNLAVRDVKVLSDALVAWLRDGDEGRLESYSESVLEHIWQAVRFTWWLTTTMHPDPRANEIQRRLQQAELANLFTSPAAETSFAQGYAG